MGFQKRGKKGQARREIVLWVIALLTLLVLGTFIYFLYAKTPALLNKETCKRSVVLRGQWLLKGAPEGLKPPLQCKTQKIEIKTTNEEEIKKEIANAMYDCWDMLGRGKIDFLEDSVFSLAGTELWPTKTSCLICSRIIFNERLKKNPKEIKDFPEYLEKTKIPYLDVTYLEFLTDEQGAKLPPKLDTVPIKTDNDYAIVYFYFKPQTPEGFAKFVGELFEKHPFKAIIVSSQFPGLAPILIGPLWQNMVGKINEALAVGYCNGDTKGCAMTRVIPYTAEALKGIKCDTLQSIP